MFTRMSDIDRMFGAMDLLRNRMNRLFGEFDRYRDKSRIRQTYQTKN